MAREEGQPTLSVTTCQEIAHWASLYLDERIENERKRQIAMHLAICAGCETYVKQIATVRDVVGLLPKAAAQPFDAHRLRQAFAAKVRSSPTGD